ncbi:MAG TPA: DUF2384 domain-containing protein [Desulfuromonadales bacterium]|nr:DUF2384 domain-containing protein [Desulfuromonadales bacterium]
MPRISPAQKTQNKQLVLTKAVVNTANYLDLPKNKLAHILGVSSSTVTRLYVNSYQLTPDKKEWDFAVLLVRLFRSLDSIVGGAADDAKKWLASENKAFAGKKPSDLIESTEGLVRVVNYLDACRAVI